MGHGFRYWFMLESWKLLCLIGLTLAVIIIFQYVELPNGGSFSPAPFAHKGWVVGNDSWEMGAASPSNVTSSGGVISSFGSHGGKNDYKEEVAAGENINIVVESISGLNKSTGGIKSHDNASWTKQFSDPNKKFPQETANTLGLRSVQGETEQGFSEGNMTFASEGTGSLNLGISSIAPASPPMHLPQIVMQPVNAVPSISPVGPIDPIGPAVGNDTTSSLDDEGERGKLEDIHLELPHSGMTAVSGVKNFPEMPLPPVVGISDMNKLLLESLSSPHSVRSRRSSPVDNELLDVKRQIENAVISVSDPSLYAPLYRNISMFKRSYELMEETLKVYIYKEGEKPILHQPVLKGIYASEGWFMKLLEANKKYVTKKPRKAHLFYLPFSSRNLEETLYVPNSHNHKNLVQFLKNYLDTIAAKYPFWNRTKGADHFLVACHDWAPAETRRYMANCIRALCNSDVKEGFIFGKDVSLPETYVRSPQKPLRGFGGKPASQRSILAFFAGNMHGYLRPILLQHWGNKDPDMKIFGPMPKAKRDMNYILHMKSSKYCICAKGYEVNSPRVVESIVYECVPVIISDNFVPPFFSILNWESFAVFVPERDIPNLKNILLSIPEKRYRELQMGVKRVQQHFLWHPRPVKYDLFHMILHSVWYNRVFRTLPR